MKRFGPKTRIHHACKAVEREILENAANSDGRGPAEEGYTCGYRDALQDILLLLQGKPPDRRHYWNLPSTSHKAPRR
jgi:hypothetical protein